MKQQRNQKAKSLGAAREVTRLEKTVKDLDSHLENGCPKIPPSLSMVKVRREWRRFEQNAAIANLGFTLANGHDQFLVVTSTLGAAIPYVDSWRLRRLRFWVISPDYHGTSLTVTPVGTDLTSNAYNDPEKIWNVSSRSVSEPGFMCIKTGKKTPLGSWKFTSNTNFAGVMFQYNLITGSASNTFLVTMDLEFEYIENYAGLALGYGVTTATTNLGAVGGRNVPGFALRGTNNLG